jgi:hypothetical protein
MIHMKVYLKTQAGSKLRRICVRSFSVSSVSFLFLSIYLSHMFLVLVRLSGDYLLLNNV